MAVALIANTKTPAGPNGGTSPSIDTTGATIIVLSVSSYNADAEPTVSDSKGNTYTQLTVKTGATEIRTRLFYKANPTVGSSHTFTLTGTASYSALFAAAFSGVITTSPFDVQNGSTGGSGITTLATGSITPNQANSLIIAGIGVGNTPAGAYSINSSMTITDQTGYAAGNNEGGGIAWIQQGAAAAFNPTWTFPSTTNDVAATIAAFKPAASTRGLFLPPSLSGLGSGGSFFHDRLAA